MATKRHPTPTYAAIVRRDLAEAQRNPNTSALYLAILERSAAEIPGPRASAVRPQRNKAGRVHKLLMSGDNRYVDYNEPGVMRKTAVAMGVPETDIMQDFAGRSTYDTCFRAHHIFSLDEAILVTQDFHLDRALTLCNTLGVTSIGYIADRRTYRTLIWNDLRELATTANAYVELFITKPLPVLGDPLPIR